MGIATHNVVKYKGETDNIIVSELAVADKDADPVLFDSATKNMADGPWGEHNLSSCMRNGLYLLKETLAFIDIISSDAEIEVRTVN